ncbi:toxin [Campylobacter sp. MIT 99-7217]|uniref:toxin n=1 Tax=Campylobacter sp. MIT 99-7217 TaxID=535091 RepID=UPI001156CE3E|nr:toxin [Campylobacter sp. MIT 99-7217]TQR31886.1 toxin [Campylobacter sp. MIT 99-7217]
MRYKIQLILVVVFTIFSFIISACSLKSTTQTNQSSLETNPLDTAFGSPNDSDPLSLGSTPTPPSKSFKNPRPIKSQSKLQTQTLPLMKEIYTKKPLIRSSSKPLLTSARQNMPKISVQGVPPDLFDRTSDFMVIMGANGVLITIWATAPGNWLWGYSLNNSADLGGYRIWRLILLPNDEVMILNFATRTTCINTYKNGVIHSPCNINNVYQKFTLRPMTNGAVQIYNKATNSCLQTPISDVFNGDDFGAINLSSKCDNSIDQQWYLLPPPLTSSLFE